MLGVRVFSRQFSSVNLKRGIKRSLNSHLHEISNATKLQNFNKVIVTDSTIADYQTTLLGIAKQANMTNQEVFDIFNKSLPENSPISKIHFTAPGFLNIELKTQVISEQIDNICNKPLEVETGEKQDILIDYASPNMCKELHVGHLRSTILGESVSRILEYLGNKVERVSHVGDFGTPIGMVITQAIETNPSILSPSTTAQASDLSLLYTAAKARSKNDEEFNTKVAMITSELQNEIISSQIYPTSSSTHKYLGYYNILCDISRKSFNEIYKSLGVTNIKEIGESFYASKLSLVVQELEKLNLVKVSEGAKCIFLKGYNSPFLIQKSDNGYLYSTTDLAALKYRSQVLKKDKIIYITDSSQKSHFQQVFQVKIYVKSVLTF